MPPPLRFKPATGPDDFRVLREEGYYFVDKTRMIAELLALPDKVLLLPRPRRFGKSLNLSMLAEWFRRGPENLHLFEDLAIMGAAPDVLATRSRYPVIHLSLKDARKLEWEVCLGELRRQVSKACLAHRELANSPALSSAERALFCRLMDAAAPQDELESSLSLLTGWLRAHHGEPAVVLIDEYDAPIEAGYTHGYYDHVVSYLRNWMSAALKTNPHLYRGVLTGVRRVSKESLFSGLNNVRVFSILDPEFSTSFGFLENEVRAVLEAAERTADMEEVRRWYNGYQFGEATVYNPWSILCYAREGHIKPYWLQTSSDELLRRLIPSNAVGLRGPFEALLKGGAIEVEIDEHVVLRDIERNPEALWSFLLTAGYLKATSTRLAEGRLFASLAIPNREVRITWTDQFHVWLSKSLHGQRENMDYLFKALFSGDTLTLRRMLQDMVKTALSFHDTRMREPERVYQAFVLGLLVWLEPTYTVRSNRESGYGRADVLIIPRQPGNPGVVLEFKQVWTREGESPEAALDSAHAQIESRDYAAELVAAGATPIQKIAIVFTGKRVWVR